MKNEKEIAILRKKYEARKHEIQERLFQFHAVGKMGGKTLFEELAFCLLTPQSKAFSCDRAIQELKGKNLLLEGSIPKIQAVLSTKTRFHNKKAEYLVSAREKLKANDFLRLTELTFSGTESHARSLILKEVKGIGWKEASHYLRNVGRGRTIAILDRHILKNLVRYGAIDRLPKSLTPKIYLQIEKKMENFCEEAGIPLSHLDLLFWAEETGRVFK